MKRVMIYEDEGRAGTFLIAKGFNRTHDQILRLVKKYKNEFEDFSPLKVKKIHGKGRPIEEFLLTEDQFIFLGTLLRNSEVVIKFKHKITKEFSKIRQQLAALQAQQSDTKWIMSRDFGKEQRLTMTDTIKEFVAYAESQGSSNANRYYTNITRMTYALLFVFEGKYKNARDILSGQQLMTLASAETIIKKGLQDCMKAKMFYRDIYQKIKKNVLTFAELNGQTKVIEEQFKLEE